MLLVGALILVALTSVVVQGLAFSALRILEGYWWPWLDPLRNRLVGRHARRYKQLDDRLQELAPKITDGSASAAERHEYRRVDAQLHRFPSEPALAVDDPSSAERLMPTRLGNILRASESRPFDKYGLDAIKCWSRLWLVLPDAAQKELGDSRTAVDSAAGVWLWGVLFAVWTVWAWWAAPVAIAVAVAAYVWLLSGASVFGDLVESAFDLYRWNLYDALHWPAPTTPEAERKAGQSVTDYLWWGSSEPGPTFSDK